MSPGPHQQHHRAPELDLERKEELILAKQLRACRVNILPRYNQDTCYQLSPSPQPASPRPSGFPSSPQPSPQPASPRVFSPPSPQYTTAPPSPLSPQVFTPATIAPVPSYQHPHQFHAPAPTVVPSYQHYHQVAAPAPSILVHSPALPPALPFLADIKQLRRTEASPSPAPPPVTQSRPGPAPAPAPPQFPFLQEIRSLGREKSGEGNNESELDRESVGPEKFQNDLMKYNKDTKSDALNSKIVRFFSPHAAKSESTEVPGPAAPPLLPADTTVEVTETPPEKPSKTKKSGKSRELRIDDKTNVSRLADQIIPQLNHMQKNFMGLLFFNELSQNIVDDIVAQQVSMMSGLQLGRLLAGLEPQVSSGALAGLQSSLPPEEQAGLLCDSFARLPDQEKAGVLFSTANSVLGLSLAVAELGGRQFKRALATHLLNGEDPKFVRELAGRLGDGEETSYNSAEESLAEESC